ncbi:hypothetical protein KC367_g272 [Hortaea werneckii]|nr:hypothetical protein KC367_g272 [Hortaea werneckii]
MVLAGGTTLTGDSAQLGAKTFTRSSLRYVQWWKRCIRQTAETQQDGQDEIQSTRTRNNITKFGEEGSCSGREW